MELFVKMLFTTESWYRCSGHSYVSFVKKSKRMIDKVINIYTMLLDYCGYKFIKTEREEEQSETSLNVNVKGF